MSFLASLSWKLKWAFQTTCRPLSVCPSVCKLSKFSSSPPEPLGANFNKLGTKHPWVKGIQAYSNEGQRSLPKGNNYEIAKLNWRNFKIFFSKTTGPISTKLGTKLSWIVGIQDYKNEGPSHLWKGDKTKSWKNIDGNLKNLLLQNHKANFNQTYLKIFVGGWDSSLFKWRAMRFYKER